MIGSFTEVKPLFYWVQHILPLVYDDSLSYMELLGKVTKTLNELVENNNLLPDYIMELIKEYISSGEIEKVLAEVLANYMLNVKFPPKGLTPAVGDGSADDTEAIQGCINYAYQNGGMAVYFPSGAYLTQPLTLNEKVTLFGQDRYTTRIVMKGGATKPLFTGTVDEMSLTGLGFDGNMDIQVNNVNLFTITVNSAIITNCLLTDGYDLLNITVNNELQLDNILFRHAVENALVVGGAGYVQGDNLIFKSLSTLIGKNYIVLNTNNSILEEVKCFGAAPNGVLIGGNSNVVNMRCEACQTPYVDNGTNNTIHVYGASEDEKFTGDVTQYIGGFLNQTVVANKKLVARNVIDTAGGTRQESTTGNKTETVNGNDTETVGGDKKETVSGSKSVIVTHGLDENIGTNKISVIKGTNTETITGLSTENANGGKALVSTNYNENVTNKNVTAAKIEETLTGNKTVTAASIIETVSGDRTINGGDITHTGDNITTHAKIDLEEQTDGNKVMKVTGTITETTGAKTETINGQKIERVNGTVEINISENLKTSVTGFINESGNAKDETYNTGTKNINGDYTKTITGTLTENDGNKNVTAFTESHNVTNFDLTGTNHIGLSTPALRHGASIEWLQNGVKGVKGYELIDGTDPYGVVTWIDPTLLNPPSNDYVTPEQFGAKGDGVTDDANAFQSALDTKKRIVLTHGKTYIIGTELQLRSGTYIEGCGAIVKASTAFLPYTNIMMAREHGMGSDIGGYEQNADITINNLVMDASKRPLVGGIGIGHAHNIRISNCEFYNWASWHPIEFNSTLNGIIDNCYFHDMFVAGEDYAECVQLDLAGGANLFNLSPFDNTPCRNILITGNRFELPTTLHDLKNVQPACIGSHSTDGTVNFEHMSSNIIVANNVCYGAQTFVLATNWRNSLITGNLASNIRCAVYTGSWDRLTVSNNNFYFIMSETFDGVYDRGVYTNATDSNSVHGNVSVKNNIFEKSLSHCIALSGTICTVENNIIRAPNMAGIYVSYAANFSSIIGNTITDEVSDTYYGIYVNPLAGTSPVSYVANNVTEKMNCTGVASSTEKSVIAYNLIKKSATIASTFTNVGNIIAGTV